MQHRTFSFSVALILCLAPVFADTSSTIQVQPANSQYVNPTTNQNASTANVSTQVNNQNLGANSYGAGVTCQSAQVALGGYGARQSSGVGMPNSDAGVTVQYLTPIGTQSARSCQSLANEVLHQRQLDTQLTFVQKCADFARAGIILDSRIYPELAHQCAGIHLSPSLTGSVPNNTYPRANTGAFVAPAGRLAQTQIKPFSHLSDFSPEHNSELQRIANHRLARFTQLKTSAQVATLTSQEKNQIADKLVHENERLRAVIAEYSLENNFLHHIAKDPSWRGHHDIRQRILSYND